MIARCLINRVSAIKWKIPMTIVIKYTQGSGPSEQWFRNCSSIAEAEFKFWSQSRIKQNAKTVIVSIKQLP